MNKPTFLMLMLAGASSLAFGSLARAQTAANAAATTEVVVTGSRVIKNGNNSPTPVSVLVVDDMQAVQPSTLGDNLNELPVFSGSRNQTGNPNPAGGNGAANELNLRNLGSNRNLILLDGHRIPPTLSDGTVDIDMIPQMLVQRVDLVTGGVSAVYGSDAISGVINFIPDKNFNGFKAQVSGGISQYGDEPKQDIGVAYGTKLLGGRLHFEASYEYRNDAGILYRTARPWDNQWDAAGIGTAQFPYELVNNVRLFTTTFGGLISSGALTGMNFKTNGVLTPFVHGITTGSACCEIGGDGAYFDDSMKAPLSSHQFFGRLDYDVTDNIHAYADFSGNIKDETQYLAPEQFSNFTFGSTNAYLPAVYQAQLAAAKQSTFKMSEFMGLDSPRQQPETKANQFFANFGLDGALGGYRWDLSYVHGWTQQTLLRHYNVDNLKLAASLDAVVNPANGQIVCSVTLTNPTLYPGCVPANVFGPTAISPAAYNYFEGDTWSTTYNVNDVVEGGVSGAPFSIWAGPVDIALSGEWRELQQRSTTSNPTNGVVDCTGLRFNCTAVTTATSDTVAAAANRTQTVWETAIETDIPLIKNLPFIQAFNLNAAARYTSYSTSGDYTTWKLGIDWHVDDSLTVRATESRDIRAPTLNDLFSPVSHGTMTSEDYLTLTVQPTPTLGGGNPNLTAEIGHTTTAGFVWRPKWDWARGFSVSLDGYHILITNALYSVMGSILAAQQACYAAGGNSPWCLQQRPFPISNTTAANAATLWINENINVADVETYGADLEINYANQLFDRPYSARLLVNYQPHLYFNTPGLLNLDHGGKVYSTNSLYPAPVWAATAYFHYKLTDQWSIDLLEHWRSAMSMRDNPSTVWLNPIVSQFYTTNLNIDYLLPRAPLGKLDIFLNIQNLFNATPPPAAFYSAQTQPGQFGGWAIGDDPVGRYFTLGAHFRY